MDSLHNSTYIMVSRKIHFPVLIEELNEGIELKVFL